jgi:predicted metal-dependent phosphotriesterase family hydrolase
MTPEIMTVTGPIHPRQMGITLMHEHLFIDLCRVTRDPDHWLNDAPLTIKEIGAFAAGGGVTVVDVTNRDLGRDPAGLQKVAQATGLNIVMGCGWYREPFYRQEVYEKATNRVADDIVREIVDGVDNTGIRPGIIGEIGCDRNYVSPAEERSFRAAARAHKRTNLTITTHAVRCPVGLDQLDVLEDEEVDLRRVIIGHCDTYPDPDYHEAVARRGAYVQFDTIRSKFDWEIESRVEWVLTLVKKGYLSQILLSHDCCMKSHLHAYGGNGYDYILRDFVPRLLAAGLAQEQIETLLKINPISALTSARP